MDDYKVSICPRNDIFYVSWINKHPQFDPLWSRNECQPQELDGSFRQAFCLD